MLLTRVSDKSLVGLIHSVSGLSSFWISNPLNYFEGNVAVGSYTAGFWIITRLGARGMGVVYRCYGLLTTCRFICLFTTVPELTISSIQLTTRQLQR